MKSVLLLLVLVNALFFAWTRWIDVTPQGAEVVTPEPEAAALVLYEEKFPPEPPPAEQIIGDLADVELDDDEPAQAVASLQGTSVEPAAESEPDEPEPVPESESEPQAVVAELAQQVAANPRADLLTNEGPATRRCLAIGPYRDLKVAGAVSATLRSAGLDPRAREEPAQLWVGHWVHLAPAGTRAAAVEVVEKLRADGVSDIYIEPSGEMRHAISLGLFTDLSRAETRAGKIRQLGVRPQIRDRFRDGTQHWVDLELSAGQALDTARFIGVPDDNVTAAERPCEDVPVSDA